MGQPGNPDILTAGLAASGPRPFLAPEELQISYHLTANHVFLAETVAVPLSHGGVIALRAYRGSSKARRRARFSLLLVPSSSICCEVRTRVTQIR